MEPKNLKQPFFTPQQDPAPVQQQPQAAVQEPQYFEPGTLANTQDTFEHQRKPRHSPMWGGIKYTTAGIFVGAATGGVGLLALPWLTYEGVCGEGSVRAPNPQSLCQDIFFYKGLCDDRMTSAAWVHCLKQANVLQHGRNRIMANGNEAGIPQLDKAFKLIGDYNAKKALEDGDTCAAQNQLTEETRAGIASVLYDFQAESVRLAPLVARMNKAQSALARATGKNVWFTMTDAVHITQGVSSQRVRQEIEAAVLALRDVSRQMNEPPQLSAWVRGQPI